MKASIILSSFFLLIFTTQCRVQQGVYSHQGITFSVPDGWKVSMQTHSEGYQWVYVVRKGAENNASWEVTSMPGFMDLEAAFEEETSEMLNSFPYQNTIELGKAREEEYLGKDAIVLPFTYRLLGIPQVGLLIGLKKHQRTLIFLLEAPVGEWPLVEEDYALLEETFDIL
ncbi:MAG TPA: hypothetical protein DCE41_20825 [Cytophagales bacterium]|nr:hypothetical protein [Cytophagales bacterium]HAA17218.1 hypothetical protein [Cytophagales bacterium]HAP62248.1 hypothetical protein [Cytophagales bacterium]